MLRQYGRVSQLAAMACGVLRATEVCAPDTDVDDKFMSKDLHSACPPLLRSPSLPSTSPILALTESFPSFWGSPQCDQSCNCCAARSSSRSLCHFSWPFCCCSCYRRRCPIVVVSESDLSIYSTNDGRALSRPGITPPAALHPPTASDASTSEALGADTMLSMFDDGASRRVRVLLVTMPPPVPCTGC